MEIKTGFANIKEFQKYLKDVILAIDFMCGPRFADLRDQISDDEATKSLAQRVINYNTAKAEIYELKPAFDSFLTKYSTKKVAANTAGRIIYIYLGILFLFGLITIPLSFVLFNKARKLKIAAKSNSIDNASLEQQLQIELTRDGNGSFAELLSSLMTRSNHLEYFSNEWYFVIPDIVNEINSGRSNSVQEAKVNLKKDEERREEMRLKEEQIAATKKLAKAIDKLNKK